uniref:Uncharacterized protein n=1 Tax=Panagrolaimus davidi TaxID=227884 RepID=A0A914Q1M7_9BILA
MAPQNPLFSNATIKNHVKKNFNFVLCLTFFIVLLSITPNNIIEISSYSQKYQYNSSETNSDSSSMNNAETTFFDKPKRQKLQSNQVNDKPNEDNTKSITNDETKSQADTKEEEKVGCLNKHGAKVKWWLNVKLPEEYEFMTYTSNDNGDGMERFQNILTESALRKTLDQYYNNEKQFTSIMYNDQSPPLPQKKSGDKRHSAGDAYAHAKGVLHCKDANCYFIQHSWPHFPPPSGAFAPGAIENGQHFFCISLTLDEADTLFKVWNNIRPYYYNSESNFPQPSEWLTSTLRRQYTTSDVDDKAYMELDDSDLNIFYKSKSSDKLLWNVLAEEFPSQKFEITSWLTGRTEPINYSEQYPFYAVLSTRLTENDNYDEKTWPFTKDHSKIAVSCSPELPVICFGDVNFVLDNTMRAGALYCFKNIKLHKAFTKSFKYDSHEHVGDAIRWNRMWNKKKN